MPIISLTTDFGLTDPFVGILKGVVLGICPEAVVVDVTHGLPPGDVAAGALALEGARPYFPAGTFHVAVVDPGVGTDRLAVCVRTHREFYVAPDNGLLSFLPASDICEIRVLQNPTFQLQPVSPTFHGRDVFAPAAAHLAAGVPLEAFGPRVDELKRLAFPRAGRVGEEVRGEVVGFDHFGNAVTSLRERDYPEGAFTVEVNTQSLVFATTYGLVPPGFGLALTGSTGRLEVCVREGSAREVYRLRAGDRVTLRSR